MLNNSLIKIASNTLVQYFGRLLSASLSAISVLMLTRYLGVEGYGNFSLIFAYLTFFAAFTDFGFQTTIVNKLAKKEISPHEIFGTYLFLKIGIIIASTFVALIILIFMPYSSFLKSAILFSSIAVGIGALGGFGNTFFQHDIRVDRITLIDVVNRGLTVGLIGFFIFLKLNFFYILSAVLISNLVSMILMFSFLRKGTKFNFDFNKNLAKFIVKDSALIGIAGFLSIVYFKVDTIMLSVFKSSTEVGFYSLAYKIFENVLILWIFYMTSFYPILAKLYHAKEWGSYKNLIRTTVLTALALSVIVVAVGLTTAPLLVKIFGGSNFSNAVLPLRILLFSCLFVFINAIFYSYFFIVGKTKLIIAVLLLSLIFNFVLNVLVIPTYGYIGASVSTVATEIFLFLCYGISLPYFKSKLNPILRESKHI